MRRALAALAGILCLGAAAADPAERLQDPAQETRARHLFQQIRCLVCQNESIDDSEADLAADLRRIVRQQIAQGRSDAEVRGFLTARYGEFVLFKPPFSLGNAALWLTPFAIVGVGGVLLIGLRRRDAPETPLNDQELERVSSLSYPQMQATVPPHQRLTKGPEK